MMDDKILEFIKKKYGEVITVIPLEDIDCFTMCILPTEEELKIIYSYGFILIKIIDKKNYSKYIFSKRMDV